MDLRQALQQVDASTAQAFVSAARHVIDALLIEARRVQAQQPPAARDYRGAALPRESPAGGWLAHEELALTAQRMAEAIAAERWVDGALFAVRMLAMLGAV